MPVPGEPSAPPGTEPLGPVAETERIRVIDILRGFALFGVLLINIGGFELPGQTWTGLADRVALWPILVLGDSKFWTLFSFLFGLGFALQMQRAARRGANFLAFYPRRLLVLLLFGLLHYVLLFDGDILFEYAVVGFVLLLLRKASNRAALVLALACLLIPIGRHALKVRRSEVQRSNLEAARVAAQRKAEERRLEQETARVLTQGSFSQAVAYRARRFVPHRLSVDETFFYLGGVFPLFLFGLLVGRRRIFENMGEYLPLIRKVLWWTLAFGVLFAATSVTGKWPDATLPYDTPTPLWRGLLWYVGTPCLSFSYTCIIIVLAQRDLWQRHLAALAAVGRTALSNYLLQSLVFSAIFQHYGMGLAGRVGPSLELALTTVIYGLQLLLSVWWLRRFRFGPAEWLWRTLTYGSFQPMRAVVRAPSAARS